MPVVERSVEESQNSRFEEVVAAYGAALERLARAYEADADTRRDLLQEILIALWRSFEGFDGRCSLRTWVYRVAHNTAASHVGRQLRMRNQAFVALEDEIAILYRLIGQLKPLDRQVMVAYLEGMDAASTAEVTGLSARNVATKIHRIKHILSRRFQSRGAGAVGSGEGGRDER
jgi:RNA polymerase sigma-70 factor (ECF subfamily)